MIRTVEFSDQGEYECRTDGTVNYIVHLIVVNCMSLSKLIYVHPAMFFSVLSIRRSPDGTRRFQRYITMSGRWYVGH